MVESESTTYKYFAFISYKSDDLKEAWALKKKLDRYKLPSVLRKQYKKEKLPTYEAFLDKTNIQPGILTDELRDNLDNSHYLIVICSPRSAKSNYVKAEIEWFTRDGREKDMYLFIIESDPNKIEDSFNPAIKKAEQHWKQISEKTYEYLGVNIKEKDVDKLFFIYRCPIIGSWLQRERAYMQLISKLLNLEFKQLWSYQKIRLTEWILAYLLGILFFVSALIFTWRLNQPFDVTASLVEASIYNERLPQLKDAVVKIGIGDKAYTDTIRLIEECVIFKEIAHRHLNQRVRILVSCKDFIPVDTTLLLTNKVILSVYRDSTVYGDVHFRLWNPDKEVPLANTEVEIAGQITTSDKDGYISLFVPLEKQQSKYFVKSAIPLVNDTIYLPCGPDDVLLMK